MFSIKNIEDITNTNYQIIVFYNMTVNINTFLSFPSTFRCMLHILTLIVFMRLSYIYKKAFFIRRFSSTIKVDVTMFVNRNRLMLVSIATLLIALLLTLASLVSFIPLFIFSCILLIAISLIADGLLNYLLFRQQDALLQLSRGILRIIIFAIIVINYLLNRI